MEEILASIRRIIEDSDTAHVPDGGDLESCVAAEAGPEHERVDEVEAFREEFGVEPEVAAPPKPASLAEIQAQAGREQRLHGFGPADFDIVPSDRSTELSAEAEGDNEAATEMPSAGFPDLGGARAENQNPKPAILSEHAGRQVAAAFDELSEAFAASRRRSFDEMAEEMLRPMLQDWLDNNLPVLVERLVREEIERVARGEAR
jgi:cell pole-organizing protein PopZ